MLLNTIIGGFRLNSSVTENRRKKALLILEGLEFKLKNLEKPEIQGGGYMIYCRNKACKFDNQVLSENVTHNGETILCKGCYQEVKLRCTCGYESYIPYGDRIYHIKSEKCKLELCKGANCKFNFEQEVIQTAKEKSSQE